MAAQIRPNRLEVSDRFPVLGFTIRSNQAPARAEVAVATDWSLFRSDMKDKRNSSNFYSSRAGGLLSIPRGEAVYIVPPEVVARFVGQERLYVGLAVAPERNGMAPQVAVMPGEGSPYISLKGLTGRSLRRVRMLPHRTQRGVHYANGGNHSLEWAGDVAAPGLDTGGNEAGAKLANGGPPVGNGEARDATAKSAQPTPSLVEYDDGFGPLQPPNDKMAENALMPSAGAVPPAKQPIAQTLDLSGLVVSQERRPVTPPSVTRLTGAQMALVETALGTLAGPLAATLLALRAAARATGVSIGAGPSAAAGFGAGADIGAGVVFGPDGGIGLYGAAEFQAGLLSSASVTAQITIVGGGIESFNSWGLAATISGGEGLVGGASALFDLSANFQGVSFQLGAGVGLSPVDFYIAVQRQVAVQAAAAQARAQPMQAQARTQVRTANRPSGLARDAVGPDVDLKLRIFIPSPFIAGPIGIFGGDGRGFSFDQGTSRAELHARVHMTAGGGIDRLAVVDRHWGDTTEYNEEDAVSVAGKPDWWRERAKGATPTRRETLVASDDNLKIHTGASGTRRPIQATLENASIITIEAAGAMPLSAAAPDIDANISVLLRVSAGRTEAKVIAEHDGFPAYELYANGQLVYSFDPVMSGTNPTALFPPMDIDQQTDWITLPEQAPVYGQARVRPAMAMAEQGSDVDSAYGIEKPIPEAPDEALARIQSRALNEESEYPQASRFVRAASSNFRRSSSERTISRIVIHITDGGANIGGPISWFRNPEARVSAHYIVGQDGEVVQMVRHNDVAWHAGSANRDSIGIEHCANTRGLVPTDTQYAASAALVRWLCDTFSIPTDRAHVLGHSEADPSTSHTGCPNAVWDWDYYIGMVQAAASMEREAAQGQGLPRGRALTDYSFSVNWDDVEPIPQPTDSSCWAAAGAMVIGWRDRVSLSPETVGEICGRSTASGLDPAQVEQFASEMGLSFEYPASYTVEGFRTLLENNGPLWVAASVPGLHAIVVTGLYSDGTSTYVRITDPWDRNVGSPGAPGKYLETHATGSRYILSWEDFVREYEAAATDFSSVNLQILHPGGTDGRMPNYGKPAGYAQSLAAKVRSTRAAARTAQAAIARAQETSAEESRASSQIRREAHAWNGVSWNLDQLDGFQLPAGTAPGAVPTATESRSVALTDWPFVPAGDARTQLPLTVSWRYGEGAVGDVRISAGTPQAAPGWALQVAGEITPMAQAPAAVRIALRHTFSGGNRPDVMAVTELTLFGDGTYQRQDRWEQAQATATA